MSGKNSCRIRVVINTPDEKLINTRLFERIHHEILIRIGINWKQNGRKRRFAASRVNYPIRSNQWLVTVRYTIRDVTSDGLLFLQLFYQQLVGCLVVRVVDVVWGVTPCYLYTTVTRKIETLL